MGDATTTSRPAWYLVSTPETVAAWQTRLRWTIFAVDAVVVLIALIFPPADFPLRRVTAIIAAAALANGEIAFRLARGERVAPLAWGAAVSIEIVLLTGLLELSGGPSNPFSVIYAAQVTLAAVLLGRRWAYLLGGWATLCYGVLISWHLQEPASIHHRLVDFPTHLFTMWLALAVAAELIVYFVGEASRAVRRREEQIEAMRARAARTDRLISLTTLTAGAAHELSTPLATIAIASRELERAMSRGPGAADWISDARLIREEVDRCQIILDQMSGRAGGHATDAAELVDVPAVLEVIRSRLPPDQASRLQLRAGTGLAPVMVSRVGLEQVVFSLVKNAFDATNSPEPVTIEAVQNHRRLRLIVQDEGSGMTPEVLRRAGDPFYTTKEPGRGLGLGLFLARVFAERCGGTLVLRSDRGTTAVLELPLEPEPAAIGIGIV